MFDILEHLHALPDPVVANVFEFLPSDMANVLLHSDIRDILEPAARRKWLRVLVCEHESHVTATTDKSSYHCIPHRVFWNMVETHQRPSRRIERLYFSSSRVFGDGGRRAALLDYVEAHVATVAFYISVFGSNEGPLREVCGRGRGLNLVSLYVDHEIPGSLTDTLGGVSTLRELTLGTFIWNSIDASRVFVPPSVVHLTIGPLFHDNEASVEYLGHLPVLPAGLQTFSFWVPDGLDVSQYVRAFPRTLVAIEASVQSLPAVVDATALLQFGLLRHNMLVYLEEKFGGGYPGVLVVPHLNRVAVDLGREGDYSSINALPGRWMEVYAEDPTGETSNTMESVSHLLPHLKTLGVYFPVPFGNATIPQSLEVKAVVKQGFLPPEAHYLRVTDLSLWSVLQVPAQLDQMEHLTRLFMKVERSKGTVKIPAPPNLRELKLRLGATKQTTIRAPPRLEKMEVFLDEGAVLPDIRAFILVRNFELKAGTDVWFTPERLPPKLWQLRLVWLDPHLTRLSFLWGPVRGELILEHLTELQRLEFIRVKCLHMGQVKLPTNLVDLRCTRVEDISLSGVEFPPKLQRLTMTMCAVKDPWQDVDTTLPGTSTPVPYPDSLEALELRDCAGVKPPPPGYSSPPNLRYLGLQGCYLEDITQHRFPPTLVSLELSSCKLPVSETYKWPPLRRLRLQDRITKTEREQLERMMPGVEIVS